ncbi:uncharacterized protein G2W53_004678 [Senna tora]|uniref:Uncharacterized protein n=1 Tax=Senna tora TaxID=362788 RepID=A0A834XC25_9FABA|nr:uncharacterized protein G2W53_004678 [Senna tora]
MDFSVSISALSVSSASFRGINLSFIFSSMFSSGAPLEGSFRQDHLSERDRSIGEGPSIRQLCLIDLRSPISGIDRSEVDQLIHQPCSLVNSLFPLREICYSERDPSIRQLFVALVGPLSPFRGINLSEADHSVRQLHSLVDLRSPFKLFEGRSFDSPTPLLS